LEKRGFQFDFFVGVSVGAIICALLACGKSADEIFKIIENTKILTTIFDFSPSSFGILRGQKIQNFLDNFFEGKTFADLKYPLFIGTTDFSNGERVMLSSGKISDAVRASFSVPVLFEPFYHKKEKLWLVDGGLTQNFPLDIAIKNYQGEKIFGVDVTGNFPKKNNFLKEDYFLKIKNLRKTAERAFRIIFKNQQRFFPDDKRVTKILPNLAKFTALDVFKLEEIAKIGEATAKKALLN